MMGSQLPETIMQSPETGRSVWQFRGIDRKMKRWPLPPELHLQRQSHLVSNI